MVVAYFRSIADAHAYAHGPLHRKAWDWWNSITKTHPHLSIMHELYEAPKGRWENIYVNNQFHGLSKLSPCLRLAGDAKRRDLVDQRYNRCHGC